MAPSSDHSPYGVNAAADTERDGHLEIPSTPQDNDITAIPSSQQSLLSTEGPPSPVDPGQSFKTELNDDRINPTIIPSSLTPPPSSQVPARSGMYSPPVTGLNNVKRDVGGSQDYAPPAPQQVVEAAPDELRSMLQACIAEHAKLKMETAHHKLQYNLLSLQADEEAKRSAVEHDMVRREVDALRMAEHVRQARRELSGANESAHAKYLQLKVWYDQALEENEALSKKLSQAKKVIQQKEDEFNLVSDERNVLLTRIRENREHFHKLCSPGGMFHNAISPKDKAVSTPVQSRATPKQTPKSAIRDVRHDRDHSQGFDVLLQALTQENNSAPSTPTTRHRAAPRSTSKHTRNVQSMSSLPTTPTRTGADRSGLLPSVNLVPQSEPPYRHQYRYSQDAAPSRSRERRKSRESTISADDADEVARSNEELARQALAASFASRDSQQPRGSRHQDEGEEEEVFESQASQAASDMLRRDPRESFEVASSIGGSRDGTPTPATEKTTKLQTKLFGSVNKPGVSGDKRKFSGGGDGRDDLARRDGAMSPTKKLRLAGGLREARLVGLGIQ